jgi:hypothetical protein
VVINIDSGLFPFGIFIRLGWQGPEGWPVDGLKQLLAGAGEFFEGMGIQCRHEGLEGRIDLREGEEGVVPEPSQQPAFHDLHPDLHLGLIPGPGSAGGDDGKAIMLREGRVGAIDLGFIAVSPGHGRLQVVGDHDLGDPTEGRKRPHMRTDPVRQTLGPGRLSIGVVRCSQDSHENRHLVHLSAVRVHHGDTLARIIDKELLPRAMTLAHDQVQLARPGAIPLTEPAVLKALWGRALVLLPQQEQGDALAFQLVVHCRPVRLRTWRERAGRVWGKEQPLHSRLIEGGG